LHRAGGAEEIYTFDPPGLRWRQGEDFDAFTARLEGDAPRVAYSAHQMGSCAMGADPRTSVADPDGRLHGVAGVWIGDASALPTAPGVNPMITIMALAERTAARLLRHADAQAANGAALRAAGT
ncbi:MAG TPA: GMC family oxidoreductase, partial [Gaiellaceae bacterium]|nr:GMC family oxidoreductase [Gaiellaceae bacterium]